ncbi:hypothetical protein DYB32_010248 [Aphanomyces invadans]|uniref:Myb-like domain-containing protein n=1 Tax=Aphanomyces invadans TaxID=157072 RepID=A0A418AGL5_9STRA|nr:hypothetical protein DYB32_010248 [Aphanomyces invadans]
MSQSDKRRNWSYEEDVALLIQVAADQPFAATKGQLTKSWQLLAETLMQSDNFTRVVDSRKVQNRFSLLVDEHIKFNSESAKLSGVDEEHREKHILLDDMVTLLEDLKRGPGAKSKPSTDAKPASTASDKDKADQGELIIREMAMQTMKRRADMTTEGGEQKKKTAVKGRRSSLATAIEMDSERDMAIREKEIEFNRYISDLELKQRELDREERKAEREHQAALAKIESEKMINLINAALSSRK